MMRPGVRAVAGFVTQVHRLIDSFLGLIGLQIRVGPGPGDDNPVASENVTAVRLYGHHLAVNAQRESTP
jgi:hypothetical protein